jgi:cytochrome c553
MATLHAGLRAGRRGFPAIASTGMVTLVMALSIACGRRAPSGSEAESAARGSASAPAIASAGASGSASSAETVSAAAQQRRRGASFWAYDCAACHGAEGESGRAGPRRVTAAALPKAPLPVSTQRLQSYANVHALMVYVRDHMPRDIAGALPADEYWDVLAYVLARRGMDLGDVPLDEARAKTLRVGATSGGGGGVR